MTCGERASSRSPSSQRAAALLLVQVSEHDVRRSPPMSNRGQRRGSRSEREQFDRASSKPRHARETRRSEQMLKQHLSTHRDASSTRISSANSSSRSTSAAAGAAGAASPGMPADASRAQQHINNASSAVVTCCWASRARRRASRCAPRELPQSAGPKSERSRSTTQAPAARLDRLPLRAR